MIFAWKTRIGTNVVNNFVEVVETLTKRFVKFMCIRHEGAKARRTAFPKEVCVFGASWQIIT